MTGTPPLDDAVVIGVDLGGTKTAAAAVSRDGAVGPLRTVPTPARAGPGPILDAVAGLVREVAAGAGGPVLGLGVGTAGVVDVFTGTIVSATDAIAGWTGTDVAGGLRDRLADLALGGVHVENDVDAHAAGEAWRGAAAGLPSVLMVAVGTGVGGAVVLDGRPLRGAHHVAGEIGHLPTPGAEGLRCTCGRPGHLEALGAGPALHRHYLALGGDAASPDTRDVVARADAGEETAVRAVRESAAAVGRATAAVVTVLDPAAVVVGGGMAGAGRLWWEAMESTLRGELIAPLAGLPVLPAALGGSAAVVGAARGAWDLLPRTSPAGAPGEEGNP
ncbi:ROK family protein [Georgenia sp. EYE_87]|uniref:ROK family protein n=1 Tax=Georgenia sp. EYE_87 TaxID=2853448 RepID=UPI002002D8FF|nr:ROK family protein [Georgenia sp. EYE_87]MCK6210487.1 ROK family protein [Georgenia sp. EYE_87]